MDMNLAGMKAIVTGGTRGIGRATAEQLATEGCHVAICARNTEQIDEAVVALAAKGVKAWGAAADVSDTTALRRWVAAAVEALGGLDIYIANVSALGSASDEAGWRKSFEVDVLGTVIGIEAALPSLERSPAGAIVVIGTTALVEVVGGVRPYRSVKAALVPYVKTLALNLAAKGVRANMVSPGTIYFKGGTWHKTEQNAPVAFQAALARNPMGRMGTPQEVANAVVFLASPAASFISGTNLIVDGAITQRVQY